MIPRPKSLTVVLMAALLGMACPGRALAQPNIAAAARALEGASRSDLLASIERLRETIKDDRLEAERGAIEALLNDAKASLDNETKLLGERSERQAEAAQAPTTLAAIRQELSTPPEDPKIEPPADATAAQLEQELANANRSLEAARAELASLANEAKRRQDRRDEIQALIPTLRTRLGAIDESLAAPAPADEAPEMTEARRLMNQSKRREIAADIEKLQAELANFEARRELLPARQDRAQRAVRRSEALVGKWQEKVAEKREQEAAAARLEAQRLKREAARQHPVLREYAGQNERLAAQRTGADGLTGKITQTEQQVSQASARLLALQDAKESTDEQINRFGLTPATGLLLRQQYEALPDLTDLQRARDITQRASLQNQYALYELRADRAGADDIYQVWQDLLERIEQDGAVENLADLEAAARELATSRRDLLDGLIADRTAYERRLEDLLATQNRLIEVTRSYRDDIEEFILWVRSVPGDPMPSAEDVRVTMRWLTDDIAWRTGLSAAWQGAVRRWGANLALLVGSVTLLSLGVVARRRLRSIAKQVASYRTDEFALTLRAIVLTAILALGGPVLIGWIGSMLTSPDVPDGIVRSLGKGLIGAAYVWAPLSLLRHTLRPNGLGVSHFRWRSPVANAIRRRLRVFTPVVVPAAGIVLALDADAPEEAYYLLGRLAFTVGMAALALMAFSLLRPRGAVLSGYLERNAAGWLDRLRFFWYPAAVLAPIALAIGAWAGYFYTSVRFEGKLERTFLLVLALVLVNALLARWLFIERRRVAVEDARRRREQAESADDPADGASTTPPMDEERLDLPAISTQTRQLFRAGIAIAAVVGLFAIWNDVTPALKVLDNVKVYEAATATDAGGADQGSGEEGGGDSASADGRSGQPALPMSGSSGPQAADEAVSVTLKDVFTALLLLAATWIVFRNLPGLVEIILLQRLPLDAGSRYALSTVLRYIIAIVGVALAFHAIEIPWSKVQWLAAALTFGLAFGLQEIFANFVSGLIILAERPFRVGDTVTINDVSGTVSRIRMRATTITDWDLKELVIPNKTFITGEVINWTLTDPKLRVTITVGVSYSSDVALVERTLLELATRHPNVLREPPPQVWFREFGDSTLNFQVRVFIPAIEFMLKVRHDLHVQIFNTFRERGIEIAFPQRDLYIRGAEGLKDIFQRSDSRSDATDPHDNDVATTDARQAAPSSSGTPA